MIKANAYSVILYKRIDNDYLPETVTPLWRREIRMTPNAAGIRAAMTFLTPNLLHDETDENIDDIADFDLFSLRMIRHGDPREISYFLSFMEI